MKHKLLHEYGTKGELEELLDKLSLNGWRVIAMSLTEQIAGLKHGQFLLKALLVKE